jgi:hypothetical protein
MWVVSVQDRRGVFHKVDETALRSLDLKALWDITDSERNARRKMILLFG